KGRTPGRRARPALSYRLARALRIGDDRGHVRRHAGIAWRNGSVPEIVDPGVTGFIVQSIDEAVEALNQMSTLDRLNVRKRFKDRFTVDRMAKSYLMLYRRLADDARSSSRPPASADSRDGGLSCGLSRPRKRALSPVDLFEDDVAG